MKPLRKKSPVNRGVVLSDSKQYDLLPLSDFHLVLSHLFVFFVHLESPVSSRRSRLHFISQRSSSSLSFLSFFFVSFVSLRIRYLLDFISNSLDSL